MDQSKILVVDDEPAVCELLKEFLEARGYGVTTASFGAEALIAVQDERPHLVLLDILMPGMDGLEVLPRIHERNPAVPVIMLTAVGDEGIAREALRRGAFEYITKPVDFSYLELAIVTALARREEM